MLLWTTESNFENDENEDRKLDSAHNNVIAAAEVCLFVCVVSVSVLCLCECLCVVRLPSQYPN